MIWVKKQEADFRQNAFASHEQDTGKTKMRVRPEILSVVAIFLAAPAMAMDNPANGKRIAEQWCSSCHVVSESQTQGVSATPTFMAIAKRRNEELEKLESFLADPHPVMPNLSLSRQQIADLVSYIRSLKP